MKTIETKVFEFDELNEDAKEIARSWARENLYDYDWYESIYEDAKNIGLEITSFDLDRNRHAKGKFLFDSVTVAENVVREHGKTTETYLTAHAYLKAYNATIITIDDDEKHDELNEDFENSLIEDYSILLQEEYEYMYKDEQIDDMIRANEYTFTETGKRFG